MLGYKSSHTVYFLKHLIFSFKTRRGLQRQNSAQANTARSVNLREVQLRAVLACAKSDSSLAVLANFGLSNLRGFEFFVNISTKTIFKQKHFSLFIRGPDGFDS